jgi:hypothetical protein
MSHVRAVSPRPRRAARASPVVHGVEVRRDGERGFSANPNANVSSAFPPGPASAPGLWHQRGMDCPSGTRVGTPVASPGQPADRARVDCCFPDPFPLPSCSPPPCSSPGSCSPPRLPPRLSRGEGLLRRGHERLLAGEWALRGSGPQGPGGSRALRRGLRASSSRFPRRAPCTHARAEPSPTRRTRSAPCSPPGAAFSDYFASIELIRQRYWDFVKVPALTQETKHAWGSCSPTGPSPRSWPTGSRTRSSPTARKQLEVLLDEPAEEFGLPARAFAAFKKRPSTSTPPPSSWTGDTYAQQLRPLLKKTGLLNVRRAVWLVQEMRRTPRWPGASCSSAASPSSPRPAPTSSRTPRQRPLPRAALGRRVDGRHPGEAHRPAAHLPFPGARPPDTHAARRRPGARQNWYL